MKTFLVTNRQSGKSTFAAYEFAKNPEKTVVISLNLKDLTYFPYYKYFRQNFIATPEALRGREDIDTVIFDEYLFLPLGYKQEYIRYLNYFPDLNYHIFSTPNKIYNTKVFSFVKDLKAGEAKISTLDFLNNNMDVIQKDIDDLYYNYITDFDCTVIYDDVFMNKHLMNHSYPTIDRGQECYAILLR